MDLKTLEYMEERASKARAIINKIAELTSDAKSIEHSGNILFQDQYGNRLGYIHGAKNGRLIRAVRSVSAKLINEEIAQLEAELAEL